MNDKKHNHNSSIIKQMIESYTTHNEKTVKKILRSKAINVVIDALEQIEDIEIIKFVLFAARNLKMGQLFSYLSFDKKVEIIQTSNNKLIKQIFSEIEVDDIYEFILDIEPSLFKKILVSIDPEIRKQLMLLSKYEEGEVGSIMNIAFFKCYEDWTVSKTVKFTSETIDRNDFDKFIYVLDEENKLVGKIVIYDVLLEKKRSKKIKDLMDRAVLSIKTDTEIEEAIQIFQKYDRESIPVVNHENEMVGIITDNDILPALQEEITEDIYKMYGITTSSKSYSRISVLELFKSRIVWLLILMTVATLTSIAIEQLTTWSSKVLGNALSTLLLVPIIPVISGTSGNAGSQSAASVIRGLSTGEIDKKDYGKIVLKELQVALLIGLSLAIFNFARLLVYYAVFFPPSTIGANVDPSSGNALPSDSLADVDSWWDIVAISAGISLCLFISISLSKIIGACLPLLAVKINTDPTAMASPMLTTLIDTATTTILFAIGTGIIYAVTI